MPKAPRDKESTAPKKTTKSRKVTPAMEMACMWRAETEMGTALERPRNRLDRSHHRGNVSLQR